MKKHGNKELQRKKRIHRDEEKAFCANCGANRIIADQSVVVTDDGMMIRGWCKKCGKKISKSYGA